MLKKITKNFLKSALGINLLAFLMFVYSKLVGKTSSWEFLGLQEAKSAVSDTNAIWIAWHARATMMPFFWQKLFNRKMAALVSPHHDGQLVANFLKHYHITPVCGSSNENPRQSALELMRCLQDGYDLFISPDGPRGPRMRMKKSPIYYAQKTGKPIICACFSSNKALVINKAWDKTMVALPFSKGKFYLSQPLYIPDELTEEEEKAYCQKLKNIANSLYFKCDTDAGREPVLPADINDIKKRSI